MERADFGPRLAAWLVDQIALSVLACIVGFVFSLCVSLAATSESDIVALVSVGLAFLIMIILFFFHFFYFGYFWSRNGKSVGMNLLNIQTLRRDGELMSFWRAGFRGTIGYYISSLIFGLGYIWAAFDQDKEAWHDKLFDTAVYKSQ
ncbi:MAG: RDD family protein [Anaerolineales bacterium]|nr:RDD family protein [Anaerolineales bacterium]